MISGRAASHGPGCTKCCARVCARRCYWARPKARHPRSWNIVARRISSMNARLAGEKTFSDITIRPTPVKPAPAGFSHPPYPGASCALQSISHKNNSQKAEYQRPDQYSASKHPKPMAVFRLLLLFVSHFAISYKVSAQLQRLLGGDGTY